MIMASRRWTKRGRWQRHPFNRRNDPLVPQDHPGGEVWRRFPKVTVQTCHAFSKEEVQKWCDPYGEIVGCRMNVKSYKQRHRNYQGFDQSRRGWGSRRVRNDGNQSEEIHATYEFTYTSNEAALDCVEGLHGATIGGFRLRAWSHAGEKRCCPRRSNGRLSPGISNNEENDLFCKNESTELCLTTLFDHENKISNTNAAHRNESTMFVSEQPISTIEPMEKCITSNEAMNILEGCEIITPGNLELLSYSEKIYTSEYGEGTIKEGKNYTALKNGNVENCMFNKSTVDHDLMENNKIMLFNEQNAIEKRKKQRELKDVIIDIENCDIVNTEDNIKESQEKNTNKISVVTDNPCENTPIGDTENLMETVSLELNASLEFLQVNEDAFYKDIIIGDEKSKHYPQTRNGLRVSKSEKKKKKAKKQKFKSERSLKCERPYVTNRGNWKCNDPSCNYKNSCEDDFCMMCKMPCPEAMKQHLEKKDESESYNKYYLAYAKSSVEIYVQDYTQHRDASKMTEILNKKFENGNAPPDKISKDGVFAVLTGGGWVRGRVLSVCNGIKCSLQHIENKSFKNNQNEVTNEIKNSRYLNSMLLSSIDNVQGGYQETVMKPYIEDTSSVMEHQIMVEVEYVNSTILQKYFASLLAENANNEMVPSLKYLGYEHCEGNQLIYSNKMKNNNYSCISYEDKIVDSPLEQKNDHTISSDTEITYNLKTCIESVQEEKINMALNPLQKDTLHLDVVVEESEVVNDDNEYAYISYEDKIIDSSLEQKNDHTISSDTEITYNIKTCIESVQDEKINMALNPLQKDNLHLDVVVEESEVVNYDNEYAYISYEDKIIDSSLEQKNYHTNFSDTEITCNLKTCIESGQGEKINMDLNPLQKDNSHLDVVVEESEAIINNEINNYACISYEDKIIDLPLEQKNDHTISSDTEITYNLKTCIESVQDEKINLDLNPLQKGNSHLDDVVGESEVIINDEYFKFCHVSLIDIGKKCCVPNENLGLLLCEMARISEMKIGPVYLDSCMINDNQTDEKKEEGRKWLESVLENKPFQIKWITNNEKYVQIFINDIFLNKELCDRGYASPRRVCRKCGQFYHNIRECPNAIKKHNCSFTNKSLQNQDFEKNTSLSSLCDVSELPSLKELNSTANIMKMKIFQNSTSSNCMTLSRSHNVFNPVWQEYRQTSHQTRICPTDNGCRHCGSRMHRTCHCHNVISNNDSFSMSPSQRRFRNVSECIPTINLNLPPCHMIRPNSSIQSSIIGTDNYATSEVYTLLKEASLQVSHKEGMVRALQEELARIRTVGVVGLLHAIEKMKSLINNDDSLIKRMLPMEIAIASLKYHLDNEQVTLDALLSESKIESLKEPETKSHDVFGEKNVTITNRLTPQEQLAALKTLQDTVEGIKFQNSTLKVTRFKENSTYEAAIDHYNRWKDCYSKCYIYVKSYYNSICTEWINFSNAAKNILNGAPEPSKPDDDADMKIFFEQAGKLEWLAKEIEEIVQNLPEVILPKLKFIISVLETNQKSKMMMQLQDQSEQENPVDLLTIEESSCDITLAQYVQNTKEPLPHSQVDRIVMEILEEVKYEHDSDSGNSFGCIHPQNILVTDERITLCPVRDKSAQTKIGNWDFTSPEVLQGKPCKASDIYSIGKIIMWLTFCNESVTSSKSNLLLEAMPFVREMIQEDPAKRPTILEVLSHDLFALPLHREADRSQNKVEKKSCLSIIEANILDEIQEISEESE